VLSFNLRSNQNDCSDINVISLNVASWLAPAVELPCLHMVPAMNELKREAIAINPITAFFSGRYIVSNSNSSDARQQ